MTVVFDQAVTGPATHALVTGVGSYAHLPGGAGPVFAEHGGLGQLSSPPHSARAFASWLIQNGPKDTPPLATVDLLVSDDACSDFVLPGGGARTVERATFDNVERAINTWYGRGNADPENQLIFFFCGHGVLSGYVTSLLMEDFGRKPWNPLATALDFGGLYDGMASCAARSQVYFVDACRQASRDLIEKYNTYAGDAVIRRGGLSGPARARYHATYYSTVEGEAAYGAQGKPSLFTGALIRALDGIGSEEIGLRWCVNTPSLHNGLDELMRDVQQSDPGLDQVPSGVYVRFPRPLHCLDGKPNALVSITCSPTTMNKEAKLGYKLDGETDVVARDPQEEDWATELQAGDYWFSAEFASGAHRHTPIRKYIYPPRREICLEVQ